MIDLEVQTEPQLAQPETKPVNPGLTAANKKLHAQQRAQVNLLKKQILEKLQEWDDSGHGTDATVAMLWDATGRTVSCKTIRRRLIEMAKAKQILLERLVHDPKGQYNPRYTGKQNCDVLYVASLPESDRGLKVFKVDVHWNREMMEYKRDTRGRFLK